MSQHSSLSQALQLCCLFQQSPQCRAGSCLRVTSGLHLPFLRVRTANATHDVAAAMYPVWQTTEERRDVRTHGAGCRNDLSAQQAASLQCAAVEHVSDDDLREAAYYAKYAFAAYGYMLYIWSKPQYK